MDLGEIIQYDCNTKQNLEDQVVLGHKAMLISMLLATLGIVGCLYLLHNAKQLYSS